MAIGVAVTSGGGTRYVLDSKISPTVQDIPDVTKSGCRTLKNCADLFVRRFGWGEVTISIYVNRQKVFPMIALVRDSLYAHEDVGKAKMIDAFFYLGDDQQDLVPVSERATSRLEIYIVFDGEYKEVVIGNGRTQKVMAKESISFETSLAVSSIAQQALF